MRDLIPILILTFVGCAVVQSLPDKVPAPQSAVLSIEALEPDEVQTLTAIKSTAVQSSCYKYQWKNRGQMPKGYIKGVALSFARAVCNQSKSDVALVSRARVLPESINDKTDALSWYNSNFKALGMSNDRSGVDTLRHVYTLLLGLGMQESSGRYCCGRDMSAGFSSAESAEAGTFQASYGSHRKSVELDKLFEAYRNGERQCHLDTFREGASCNSTNAKNWGNGPGAEWQQLIKSCPAFSAEWAAVLVRLSGGTRGEFGPLRTKAAEVRAECDSFLKQVQNLVEKDPSVCGLL